MKKSWRSFFSILALFLLGATSADGLAQTRRAQNGGRGPGGGDVLQCLQSKTNRFEGIYSYDYIQTRDSLRHENEDEFTFSGDCKNRLEQMATQLETQNPVMAVGLKDYIASIPFEGGDRNTPKRRWVASGKESAPECHSYDLKDETHLVAAPNCETCQLFIRDYSRTRPQVLYTYNSGLFAALKKRPTQCSYALIHEWARDFLPDSKDLYHFTASLHSKKFMKDGELSLIPLDARTESCFEAAKHAPLGDQNLALYFKISALVPPSQAEVERYQSEMERMNADLDLEIDRALIAIRENPPLGHNQRQANYLSQKLQTQKLNIMMNLDQKKITHAEAYSELKMIESKIPSYRPAPLDLNMIFLAPPMEGSRFIPIDEGKKAKIKVIKTKPLAP